MSEIKIKKLNLRALKQDPIDTIESSRQEEHTALETSSQPKISLNMKKNETGEEKTKETVEVGDQKTVSEEPRQEENTMKKISLKKSNTPKIDPQEASTQITEDNVEEKAEESKDEAEKFLEKINKEEELAIKSSQEKNKKEKIEAKDVEFSNYESKFKQQSTNVIKRIQNFKYTPKTRIGLLLGIITITCCMVGGLLVFMPERHSIEIYKTSILEIYRDMRNQESSSQEISATGDNINSASNLNTKAEIIKDSSKNGVNIISEEEIEKREEKKKLIHEHLLNKYNND